MLIMEEYEGYNYSIFGEKGNLLISIQDHNGKDILDEDQAEETYSDDFLAGCHAETAIEEYIEGNLIRGYRFYSYEQAVKDFKEINEPLVVARYSADDVIALREAFNNWSDMLCKDGQIDDTQYYGWDNPY